jgi:hypothetical protein
MGSLIQGQTHYAPKQKKYASRAMEARYEGLGNAAAQISDAQGGLKGYREYGNKSLQRQERLFNDPSYLEQTGGYKFAMDQGLKGTTAARSRSSIFSGETLKALTEYSAGLASQTYDAEWKRLQEGINTGMDAEKRYGDLATTGAEIQAGRGEAGARFQETMASYWAGYENTSRAFNKSWNDGLASSFTGPSAGG